MIARHARRSWLFGLALAAVDGFQLDTDLFNCAALLHDYGLVRPTRGCDSTWAGAVRAIACADKAGLPPSVAEVIADAICVHPTPGVSIDLDGAFGCYLQWGAMADVTGLRLADVTKANRQEILRRHPFGAGFRKELVRLSRHEAEAVREGRFALLKSWCCLSLLTRIAPLPDR